MDTHKKIFFFGYGPTVKQIKNRVEKDLCMFVEHYKFNSKFVCDNSIEPFTTYNQLTGKPIKFKITEAMLCDNCLLKLSNKYEINFKIEILNLIFYKGGTNENLKKGDTFPLIKSLKKYYENHAEFIPLTHESIYSILSNNAKNTEGLWGNNKFYLQGIPVEGLENFSIKQSYEKNSSYQGKFNGPDFVFEDKRDDKTIGFEIVSYKGNITDSFKNIESAKKFAIDKIYNTSSFDEIINELKKIIENKSNKKYVGTNELYVGIVVNNVILEYEYYVLELILNKGIKLQNIKLNGVFIL